MYIYKFVSSWFYNVEGNTTDENVQAEALNFVLVLLDFYFVKANDITNVLRNKQSLGTKRM